MIDALISWSLKNRAAVLVMAALLLVIGGYTALKMPLYVFPDLTAPKVTVITEARGMAPSEVESQVTFPIEAAVNGASGVRRVRSATAVGLSIVWIEFGWGTDIYAARQIVSEKVNVAAAELPEPQLKSSPRVMPWLNLRGKRCRPSSQPTGSMAGPMSNSSPKATSNCASEIPACRATASPTASQPGPPT